MNNKQDHKDFYYWHDKGVIRKVKITNKEPFPDFENINNKINELAEYMEENNLEELEFNFGFPAYLKKINGAYIAFSKEKPTEEEENIFKKDIEPLVIKDN